MADARDTRVCRACWKPFYRVPRRKGGQSRANFARREFCSVKCSWDHKAIRRYGVTLEWIRHVLEYDPELENWQICERFGVDLSTAQGWREQFPGRPGKPQVGARERVSG